MKFKISKEAQAQIDTWSAKNEDTLPLCVVTVELEKELNGEFYTETVELELSPVTVDEICPETRRELERLEFGADLAFVESVKFLN